MLARAAPEESYIQPIKRNKIVLLQNLPIDRRGKPSISRFLVRRLTVTIIAPPIYAAIFHRHKCVGVPTGSKTNT
ncbi:hypothetical protein Zm00014a_001508 [Zea mays]|uniref:Uncharacterized protein n=1 Tax=Zea mays TaxID=4577 RepID=A0A317YDK1_MAIZE|nr:hypothetical protein Zm00014a_001508 [Zea mays]